MNGRVRAHPALPIDQWPEADRSAWQDASRPREFLEQGGKVSSWRPASRRAAEGTYARWLGWLRNQGIDLGSEAPADRITPERMREYVSYLKRGCAPVTVVSYVGVFCMAMLAVFRERDWRWLSALQRRLRRRATPVRNKSDRLVPAGELFQLGSNLMQAARETLDYPIRSDADRRRFAAAARDYRDGLIIALMSLRPLRQKNLLEIDIGVHLRQSGDRTIIQFQAHEMKNHRAYWATWPNVLTDALDRYLSEVRPILIAGVVPGRPSARPRPLGARLWAAQGGTPLCAGGLQKALARHTRRRFGRALNVHLIRDCVVSTLANEDPDNVAHAAALLGHSGLGTAERSYIAADGQLALARYHERIAAARRGS